MWDAASAVPRSHGHVLAPHPRAPRAHARQGVGVAVDRPPLACAGPPGQAQSTSADQNDVGLVGVHLAVHLGVQRVVRHTHTPGVRVGMPMRAQAPGTSLDLTSYAILTSRKTAPDCSGTSPASKIAARPPPAASCAPPPRKGVGSGGRTALRAASGHTLRKRIPAAGSCRPAAVWHANTTSTTSTSRVLAASSICSPLLCPPPLLFPPPRRGARPQTAREPRGGVLRERRWHSAAQ